MGSLSLGFAFKYLCFRPGPGYLSAAISGSYLFFGGYGLDVPQSSHHFKKKQKLDKVWGLFEMMRSD